MSVGPAADLAGLDLMMGRGLRRCPPGHLLVTYGDTGLFFFPPSSPQKIREVRVVVR